MNTRTLLTPFRQWTTVATVLLSVLCGVNPAQAVPPVTSTATEAVPPNVGVAGNIKAMMMLTASKDHTLFGPMYTDFEDLDGDGTIEVTFKPDFKYYGYFDATKCYLYANSRFEPDTNATVVDERYECGGSGQWSGNFLNWATMTRLDVVRKMLYGGQRQVDSATDTVLQVARLSRDSHSFVKYYRGTDIRKYTPFTTANLTKTGGSNPDVYAGLTMCMQANNNDDGSSSDDVPQIRLAKGNYRMWATVEGGTVCNYGSGSLGAKLSRYYGGTAAYQGNGGVNHEASPPNQTTDGATYSSIGPILNARVKVCVANKLGDENCQAYGTGSSLVYKPVGLLQQFGTPQGGSSSARAEFGLITGSYDQNLKAGVLRKNMLDLSDEVKPATGQFCFTSGASCSGTLADGRSYTSSGAIKALDSIVLYGKTDGNYTGSNVHLPSELTNGTLSAWGNPVGEMVVQALQYYGGLTSTNPSTTTKDSGASMPVATWADPLSDSNAVRLSAYGKAVCRPLNILAISSSSLSFDGDDADTPFATLPNRSRGSLTDFTNAVGVAESIHGSLRSVGNVAGTWGEECSAKTVASLATVNGLCPEAPAVGGSYKIAGAALYANTNRIRTVTTPPPDLPEDALKVKTYAASLAGGVARVEVPIPNTNPKRYVYITPEGLWAANSNAKKMPAAMLTFNAISSSATHGAFMVTWNDSLFGGDYDMDVAGYLRYDIVGTNQLRITTDIINVGAGWTGAHGFSVIGTNRDGRYLTHRHQSSDSIMSSTPGYLCGINGYRSSTNLSTLTVAANGVFPGIPSGAMGNNRGDHACDTSSAWNTIRDRDSPVSITFTMTGADSVTLRDPLWYAAKYGSFTPTSKSDNTELPNLTGEWDVERNDGEACSGTSCQDGEPDGYFLARRPELLEKRLEALLRKITSGSNSSPSVSSSQLTAGGYLYMASFSKDNLWGTVKAFQLSSSGTFNLEAWDGSKKLAEQSTASRQVITNKGNSGVAFTVAQLSDSPSFTALKGTGTGTLTDTQVGDLIAYVRGNRSLETPAGPWRLRAMDSTKPVSASNPAYLMGTIVNSSPWLQSTPSARQLPVFSGEPTYESFVNAQKTRPSVLWAGSNDGMLHAFRASGTTSQVGTPLMSYVPSPLLGRLRDLSLASNNAITAGMDGSPFTADVLLNTGSSSATWKTYLFSSLGRGGKAVYALDVTSTAALNESNASSIFKWMFSSDDDADLGYVVGDPKSHPDSYQASPVVRMENGKYAVLVPNGIQSTSGKAFLYVLFVDGPTAGTWTSGTNYIKIATDNLTNNGMVGVTWADTDRNGKADTVYGTDLLGRLWKFDMRGTTPSNWAIAQLGGVRTSPLFQAMEGTNRIPVSTAPTVSFPSFGGVMVGFGTGKSLFPGEFPDSSRTQRFFGIYDKANWATTSAIASDLSTMVRRTATRDATTGNVIITAASEINGTTVTSSRFDQTLHEGWYINFPSTTSGSTLNSEMLLSPPEVAVGTLYFTTVRPAPSDINRCFRDPQTTFYAVDPVVGTPKVTNLGTVQMTVNGQTVKVNVAGKDGSGTQKRAIGIMVVNGKRTVVGAGSNASGAVDVVTGADVSPARSQWREIPNMRTLDLAPD